MTIWMWLHPPLVLAHDTSIESDISHSSIAGGTGTVEDVPNARIVTSTGLEEVCIVIDSIC